jgi:hypothetical protein
VKAKAIYIDAAQKTVTEVVVTSLEQCQTLVGGYLGSGGRFDRKNALYVDDDGRLKNIAFGFRLIGSTYDYYVGNGLILGNDDEGETVSTTIRLREVEDKCAWVDLAKVTHAPSPFSVHIINDRVVKITDELRKLGLGSVAAAQARGWLPDLDDETRRAVDVMLSQTTRH